MIKFVAIIIGLCVFNIYAQQEAQAQDKAPVNQEYAENYVFADPNDRKLFLDLTSVLRCPKCQNQNIADSDAPIAHDMRRKVYQLINKGMNEAQVIDWMKERYGNFVYYQPPVNAVTIWLWLLPVFFALVMLVIFIRRRKPAEFVDVDAKIAQANKMLKDD